MSSIFAHRGASGYLPEMTKEAYELALEMGVEGVEVDVRLTKDNVLVAVHDRSTKRVADQNINIAKTYYQKLLELNFFGEKSNPGFFKILKLTELIDILIQFDKPIVLAIESKHPSVKSFILEKRIVETLKKYNIVDGKIKNLKIILISFNPFAVRIFKKLLPKTSAVMLVEKNYPFLGYFPTPGNAEFVGPSIQLLNKNPKLFLLWRKKGKNFYVWTVDQPNELLWCFNHNIEMVASNYPDVALALRKNFKSYGPAEEFG